MRSLIIFSLLFWIYFSLWYVQDYIFYYSSRIFTNIFIALNLLTVVKMGTRLLYILQLRSMSDKIRNYIIPVNSYGYMLVSINKATFKMPLNKTLCFKENCLASWLKASMYFIISKSQCTAHKSNSILTVKINLKWKRKLYRFPQYVC